MWRLALACVLHLTVAQDYLLPSDVVPHHYHLKVLYDIDPETKFGFVGTVEILMEVKKPTSTIYLHAEDFKVSEKAITLDGPQDPAVTDVQMSKNFNFLMLTLDKELQKGQNYTLFIPFYGSLAKGLDGVYISQYVNKTSGANEYLIATQFEAISARKGFPCFDEPMLKATFKIIIGHHRNYTSVSNMPLEKSYNDNILESSWSWQEISPKFKKRQSEFIFNEFANSVPMSTYLVAFVVSKFSYVTSPPELSSTTFRIWARQDAISQTQYASTIGPRVLEYFSSYFNVSFPLPKQDMIALPDFSAGAMENWGLITYRETALLYDSEQSSFTNKERVAEVIAHELAHQWFGNLVTMKWWSDLWLNEGFATYVASVGVSAVEPEWKANMSYAAENILSVLNLDALESSHPVSVEIDDPKRISEIFDEISYRKGSSLIRMMVMFLGEDIFRKAINRYLVKYSYQNAEQDDLWRELTEVCEQYGGLSRNVSVKEIMDTWTKQTGYPLLTVNRDYNDNTLTLSQRRFLALGGRVPTSSSWWVPLRVQCEGETALQPVSWLAAGEGVASLHRYEHGSQPDQWLLFNSDMIAPYRVNYDSRNWQLLTAALKGGNHTAMPVLGRVQLLSDAFALAWTNILDYTTTIDLASYLQHETEYLPLKTGVHGLAKIENVIRRTSDFGAFQKFARKIITDTYHRVGGLSTKSILRGDSLESVKMQVMTSSWACRMKVPGCEENAIALFKSWMDQENPDENNPIPLDLRRIVYCTAVSRGSVAEWRFALSRMRSANVASARDALQMALTCTRDVWLLKQYLEWTITDGSEVRRQDAGSVIGGITHSEVGYYIAKGFIYGRIAEIFKAFDGQGRRVGQIVKSLVSQFTSQEELDEFKQWQTKNSKYLEDSKLAVKQAIESAEVNIAWTAKNKALVVDKLRQSSM